MKLFIFDVNNLTDNYHPYGSCAIIANDIDDAKSQFDEYRDGRIRDVRESDKGRANAICLTHEEIADVRVFELAGDYLKEIILFPDSGCC